MDENTVNRTKAAINALIDVEQLWIENTPDYKIGRASCRERVS
jgi:hypothetical protein